MEALLVLEDGMALQGRSFGALGECTGEVVFNTGMTGYQEIITDPSYRGQMVVMTYPHIGNTGINPEDPESAQPHLRALIVRDVSKRESNWRAKQTLNRYLSDHDILALTDIDTRALTRHIRQFGALRGVISTVDLDPASLQRKALAAPTTSDEDLVGEVTCAEPYEWTESVDAPWHPDFALDADATRHPLAPTASRSHVVAYDCGIKRNIMRQLVSSGCRVTVVPAHTTAEDALALDPDGVFLSNGPGDPENVPYTIDAVQGLIGVVPIFGICLGHQVLGMALGGRKYKLKFGHHGSNHPVKDLATSKIAITAQNHNFAIDAEGLPGELEVTHLNLYDHTVEGLRHRSLPVFSVQYHPEAAPGPHDANLLFERFVALMRGT
jgi:carbamoyl-phosphate synthase small subunit